MPIINRSGVFPPGGWRFYQPELNWRAPDGLTFNQCVDAIIKIRTANPRFQLSVNREVVADTLEMFTCHRINFDPHYCTPEVDAQKKTPSPDNVKPSSPAKGPSSVGAGLVAVAKSYSAGSQILTEWLGEGGKPVNQQLADQRATTCISCPFNVPGNWKTKVGKEVAKAVLEHLRAKNDLAITVANESKLGTCNACLCHLPLKVWTPLKHILAHTSPEVLASFHPKCWILHESKKKILCVIPFHKGDVKLTEKLLGWIKELGGCPDHPCLLIADAKVTEVWAKHLIELSKGVFRSVSFIRGPSDRDMDGWPIGPNWMHRTAREHIARHCKQPWLWLEPDTTPLVAGWLDKIEEEYVLCGKACLGAILQPEEPHLKQYMAGVAVYPDDAWRLFDGVEESQGAFDVVRPERLLPYAHSTQLIQHRWGIKNLPPTFKEYVEHGDPAHVLTLAAVSKQAVLFHRCKDGSLIDVLREMKTIRTRPKSRIIPMIAHIDQSSGYGTLSIQMATALMELGYPVELYPPSWNENYGTIPPKIRAVMKTGDNPHRWHFVLFPVVFQPGNLDINDSKDIAYFSMWESARLTSPSLNLDKDFTKGVKFLNRCKVAITPCSWNASSFSSCGVDSPLRICPLGCDTSVFSVADNIANGTLVFGTAAKTAYGGIRKGFNLVVAAFQLAFPTEKDVRLKVKSFSEDPPIETNGDKRIEVFQQYLAQPALVEWYRSLNVFVSGSASEGWGRHQHEAACMGRPLIGIDFGGVSEFFSYENGYPVDFKLVPAEGIYTGMGVYGRPSVPSMAAQMRRAYENRAELMEKSHLAAKSARRFTLERSAKTLVSILKEFNFLS